MAVCVGGLNRSSRRSCSICREQGLDEQGLHMPPRSRSPRSTILVKVASRVGVTSTDAAKLMPSARFGRVHRSNEPKLANLQRPHRLSRIEIYRQTVPNKSVSCRVALWHSEDRPCFPPFKSSDLSGQREARPSPQVAKRDGSCMGFSLPDVGSLPNEQGDSAWMPNSAAGALLGGARNVGWARADQRDRARMARSAGRVDEVCRVNRPAPAHRNGVATGIPAASNRSFHHHCSSEK